jgi:hypothetical protein
MYNLTIQISDASLIVIISDGDALYPPYRIVNQAFERIVISQSLPAKGSGYDFQKYEIYPDSQCDFFWENALITPLRLRLIIRNISLAIDLDQIGYIQEDDNYRFLIYPDGRTKILLISEKSKSLPKFFKAVDDEKEDVLFDCSLTVHQLGISLIDEKPSELISAFIENIVCVYVLSDSSRKVKITVESFQIDSSDLSAGTPYPVMFYSPIKRGAEDQPFLELRIFESFVSERIYNFKYFGILLQESELLLDELTLFRIIGIANEITPDSVKVKPITDNLISYLEKSFRDNFSALVALEQKADKMIFFDHLEIYSIKLLASFSANVIASGSGVFDHFTKSFGILTKGFKDISIKLDGQRFLRAYASPKMLMTNILELYKKNILATAVKVLGSVEILGNPVGLFTNIGSGVQDFISEPAEGFSQGPAEFGMGVVKGTASLFKHTVKGVGGAFQGITSSVANVSAMLSMDDEFIQKRAYRSAKNKPKDLVSGTVDAGKKLGRGIFEGVTGVITAPIKGAQKGGILGFAKGIAKGTVGLALKPITGVFDAAASVSSSIKNVGDDSNFPTGRFRHPRMLYGQERAIKVYNPEDAWLNHLLHSSKLDLEIQNSPYHGHYIINDHLLVFLELGLLCLTLKSKSENSRPQIKSKEWIEPWPRIRTILKPNLALIFILSPNNSSSENEIQIPSSTANNRLHSTIERLRIRQVSEPSRELNA